jgi:pilus assembly protein CpaB
VPARRIIAALLTALLFSGGFTYLLSRRIEHQAALRQQQTILYPAPAHPLQPGEVLELGDLHMTAWPASSPVSGTVARIEDAVGRAALYPLEAGRPLLERELTAIGVSPGLAGKIPDGMRAIALRSDEVVGVAGFLAPGSHLDVLVTYRAEQSQETMTATVLQDAEVVAADHQIDPDPQGKPSSVSVVTLLLNPQEAERAVLASTQGTIHFVLRNSTDRTRTESLPLALSELTRSRTLIAAGPIRKVVATKSDGLRRPHAIATSFEPFQIETILGDQSDVQGSGRVQP